MFFDAECPVPEDERQWIEASMEWLREQFGDDPLKSKKVVTPTPEFFPDPFDRTLESVERLFERVCTHMLIDPRRIAVAIYEDDPPWTSSMLPLLSQASHEGAAGVYLGKDRAGDFVLALEARQIGDAVSLVATVAHELGHVHLLGEGRLTGQEPDYEPLTDLLTVFLGMGVFAATAAFQFNQWQYGQWAGWSARRSGYLSEEQYGYSLALLAWLRSESKPHWVSFLPTGTYSFFRKSERFLAKHEPNRLTRA